MIEVVRSAAPLGAEVKGVDVGAGVDEATFARVRDALHERSVIVLRDQKMTPEQQVAFCARFGSLERHALPQYIIDGYPALARISNILDEAGKPIGVIDAGRVWHSDGAFAERPNMYSMLYALEIPRDDAGRPLGATLFVSTAHAYDILPAASKARVDGLRASNSLAAVYRSLGEEITKKRAPLNDEQKREFLHPVVRTHPVTGRKCIYVSRAATMRIEGLPEAESSALIDELADWCVQEDAIYRHEWREGDLLIWDNCSSQHFAIGDYALPQRRLLHRATVGGSIPF